MKFFIALISLLLIASADAGITVSITSPVNGAVVSGTIHLTASASTTSGTITKVQFFSDIAFIGEVATSPYVFQCDTSLIPNGARTLTAKAFDSLGNFALSTDISITVTNPTLGVPYWVREIASASPGSVTPLGIVADRANNAIATGFFQVSADFGTGAVSTTSKTIFIAKYSPTNTLLWLRIIGIGTDQYSRAIAVDSEDNIVIAGDFSSALNFGGITLTNNQQYSSTASDMFVAKYSASGTLLWATNFGGPSSDSVGAVAIDQNNDVLVLGYFMISATFGGTILTATSSPDIALFKLSGSTGAPVWAKALTGTSGEYPGGIAVDSSGNPLVTGLANGPMNLGGGLTSGGGVFIGKYAASNGAYQWSKMVSGASGKGIAVDPVTGNVFVTGSTSGSDFGGGAIFPPGFIVSYDSSSNYLWSSTLAGIGNSVAADGNGYIAIAGSQLFIISATTSNRVRWSHSASASTSGTSVAYDSLGRILEAGAFQTTVDFGGISKTPASGATDGFVVQYQNIHFPSVNPFSFSPSTYGPLASNQSKTITVTYTAPSDSSVSSNALVFTDNSGVTIAPITGGPAAPSSVHINGGNGNDVGVTNSTGTTLQLISDSQGADPRTYYWRKTSTVISTTTDRFYVVSTNAQTSDSGRYDVIVSNAYGSATSPQIYVQIVSTPGSAPFIFDTWTNYASNVQSLTIPNITLHGTNRMILLMGYDYTSGGIYGFQSAMLSNGNSLLLAGRTNYFNSGGHTFMYFLPNPHFSTINGENVTLSGPTINSESAALAILLTNTYLSYQMSLVAPASSTNVGTSDTITLNTTNGELILDFLVSSSQVFSPSAGQTLIARIPAPGGTYLQASYKASGSPTTTMGWSGSSDTFSHMAVSIHGTPQPIPLVQPLSTNIPLYAPFSLSIQTEGSESPSYQWKKNLSPITSTNLTGTTTTNLQFLTATTNDSGYYTVLVTNQVGSIMSYPALANIYVPPPQPVILNPPVGVTNYYGSNITFGVFASGNPTLLYQWRHNSNIIISANSPSYSKSNVSTNDQGWYDVQIANSYGNTSSVPVFAKLDPFITPPPPKVVIRGKMTIQGKAYIQ